MINEDALFRLGVLLRERGYHFTTITPLSHSRVVARAHAESGDESDLLRDVFGWSKAFDSSALPGEILELLHAANLVERVGEGSTNSAIKLRSKVRFSTIEHVAGKGFRQGLYVHSAYPTQHADSVFFGPDTYRFVSLIERELQCQPGLSLKRIVDIGCGGGPGGISAVLQQASAALTLTDINPVALVYANVNARLAGLQKVTIVLSDLFTELPASFDLIMANPPYLIDADARIYRHGGGEFGSGLSTRIVEEGMSRLSPDGLLIVYTGAPVVAGIDTFRASVASTLERSGLQYSYTELDPDVFGEELDNPGYENVERIAAVGLVVRNRPAMR